MADEKRTEEVLVEEEESLLSDEKLSANAERNRQILRRTALIERGILIAVTIGILVALIIMGFRMF